jgi:ubiquinone/menaquinone biosynthesis C-methylase UbiE
MGVVRMKKSWDNSASTFDDWYRAFEGAVENYVDWVLLKKYLPKNKDARILDAAGGTGRITLPLAKMGYSVTLCDISPRMLDVAKQKMLREGAYDKVRILKCDIRELDFADDESFDFVLCWDGAMEAAEEIVRVTKKRGRISVFLLNKWAAAVEDFHKNPDSALALIESKPCYVMHHGEKYMAVSSEEARNLFEAKGIRVLNIYAVCGWADMLRIPEKTLNSRH